MELSSQEAEIPMPINSVYGGVHCHGHGHAHQGHMTHQHHHQHQDPPSSSTSTQMPSNNPNSSNGTTLLTNINNGTTAPGLEDKGQEVPYGNRDCNPYLNTTRKKSIRYRECQKNHAASMGGDATDGCGEFMPNGEEGTFEALTCSACNCHRNFHRKEIEGDQQLIHPPPSHHFYLPTPPHHPQHFLSTRGRKVILGSSGTGGSGSQGFLGYPTGVHGASALIPVSRAVPINMPYQVGPGIVPSEPSDEHDQHHHHGGVLVKKRFRTKFNQEQKEKMLEFAEKVGWKIQKQEEGVVQQFCQEVGVKRRVLKVWMHNNKHNYAKKNDANTNDNPSSLI